jgi:6-phosphogluconolactonase
MSDAKEHLVFATSCAAGDAATITAFNLNTATATLTELHRNTEVENPFFIALSPDRKCLYSVHVPGSLNSDTGRIAAFEIVGDSGQLRKLNEQSANGITTCYVDVDPTGKAVVFANYTSGSIGSYPVQADGSLGEMVSFVQHQGASLVNANRQEAAHAHCSVISPNGKHMYACDLGMDQILGYALNAESATLTPHNQSYVRTIGGGGPRHFTYHPQGGYVYANNELDNSVNVYSYDESSGTLIERQVISSLPDDFEGESYTADIKITPDGRYLYCTNRMHDSIAAYSIGNDGCLTLIDIQSSQGNFAQNLAITPDGTILLCANMQASATNSAGENIAVFRIDPASGKLSAVGTPVAHAAPSCIMIV